MASRRLSLSSAPSVPSTRLSGVYRSAFTCENCFQGSPWLEAGVEERFRIQRNKCLLTLCTALPTYAERCAFFVWIKPVVSESFRHINQHTMHIVGCLSKHEITVLDVQKRWGPFCSIRRFSNTRGEHHFFTHVSGFRSSSILVFVHLTPRKQSIDNTKQTWWNEEGGVK